MPTALFDGSCFICRAAGSIIKSLDWMNRIEFLDLHELHESETLPSCFSKLDDAQLMGEIHVLDSDGRRCVGYDGIRRLLKEVPLGMPVWLLLHLPGLDWIGRRVYRFIAGNRYRIRLGCESSSAASAPRDDCPPCRQAGRRWLR